MLSEWLVDAALLDGFPVHGTSIPGVAQRTGSTTYYVELYTEIRCPARWTCWWRRSSSRWGG